ncbi:MAG: hypothetical protein DMG42_05975 [Acidobacteria bacterium]|nr:MAG: hypothetical protein DMG42_05975 [Acidobacteriota bacterium]
MQAANLIAPLFAGIRRAAHPLASDPGECLEGLHFGAAIDQSVGGSLAAAHRWDNAVKALVLFRGVIQFAHRER